jgi:hypothetical protein
MKAASRLRTVRTATRAAAVALVAVGLLAGAGISSAQASTGNTVYRGSQAHWITASYDGMNLAVANNATWAGAPVIQWYNDGGTEQKWYFDQVYDTSGGFQGYMLRNENSGMCLLEDGIAGDWLYQEPCDQNNAAELFWHYGAAGTDNHFQARNGGLYVDVSGYSYGAGANIDGWYQNGGANQNFWVTNVSS